MPVGKGLKAIKGGNVDNQFVVRTVTFRGVVYTITELDVPEYEECLKLAEREDGTVPFADLLKHMAIRTISPSPAARRLPYPVYRTLENIVNVMHFLDLADETEPETSGQDPETEAGTVPNA